LTNKETSGGIDTFNSADRRSEQPYVAPPLDQNVREINFMSKKYKEKSPFARRISLEDIMREIKSADQLKEAGLPYKNIERGEIGRTHHGCVKSSGR